MFIQLFRNEFRRELVVWWSYRVNAIGSLLMWGIIFPILMVTLINVAEASGVQYDRSMQTATLIGFLVWKLCTGVLSSMPSMIEAEVSTGTLENLVLSSHQPFIWLFSGRVLARSIFSFMETVLLAAVLSFVFRLPLSISPTAVFVLLLTLGGVVGVGFALAGLALIYKSISSVTELVGYLAFSISGAFIPINALGGLFTFLKYTFPMTWGITLLRDVMQENVFFVDLLYDREIFGLMVQTAFLFAFGLFVFQFSLRAVFRQGELGSV